MRSDLSPNWFHRAGAAIVGLALLLAPLLAPSGSGTISRASADSGRVGLVVQDGPNSQPRFQCVQLTPQMSGNQVLTAAHHQLRFDKSNFLSGIDGVPTTVAPFDEKHPRYWSYWQLAAGGKWTYSNVGADKSRPKAGSVEGWFYFDGATYAPGVVTFDQVCPATQTQTATPTTTASATNAVATSNKKSGSALTGTLVALVAVAALGSAAVLVARRRRVR
jgi:hypothetical protein